MFLAAAAALVVVQRRLSLTCLLCRWLWTTPSHPTRAARPSHQLPSPLHLRLRASKLERPRPLLRWWQRTCRLPKRPPRLRVSSGSSSMSLLRAAWLLVGVWRCPRGLVFKHVVACGGCRHGGICGCRLPSLTPGAGGNAAASSFRRKHCAANRAGLRRDGRGGDVWHLSLTSSPRSFQHALLEYLAVYIRLTETMCQR
jgi:hypothetical protein